MDSQNSRSDNQRMETLPLGEPSNGEGPFERLQVPVVDFAENDDDVNEISSGVFAQAAAKTRRTRRRVEENSIMNMVGGNQTMPTYFMHNREGSTFQPISDIYINLDLGLGNTSQVGENATNLHETNSEATPQPEPKTPESPIYKCPICKGPCVEETLTRCGHIFCKMCIRPTVSIYRLCPVCGAKATPRGLVRVFLPATTN